MDEDWDYKLSRVTSRKSCMKKKIVKNIVNCDQVYYSTNIISFYVKYKVM